MTGKKTKKKKTEIVRLIVRRTKISHGNGDVRPIHLIALNLRAIEIAINRFE